MDNELNLDAYNPDHDESGALADLANAVDLASDQDKRTWVMSNGKRVAAIVPVDQGEHLERWEAGGYVAVRLEPSSGAAGPDWVWQQDQEAAPPHDLKSVWETNRRLQPARSPVTSVNVVRLANALAELAGDRLGMDAEQIERWLREA